MNGGYAEELPRMLRLHFDRYPLMEAADAVKLIYQNEFAGGHLISDAEDSLERLEREWEPLAPDLSGPTATPIGNGLCRVELAAAKARRITTERINDAFVETANSRTGSLGAFKKKLGLLEKLCREGYAPFDMRGLEAYLAGYASAGYPTVSHSEAYAAAYRPHYRVVDIGLLQAKSL